MIRLNNDPETEIIWGNNHSSPNNVGFSGLFVVWSLHPSLFSLQDLELNWVALLVEPGTYLYHKDQGVHSGGYVLAVSQHCVTMAAVDVKMVNTIRYLSFDIGDRQPWSYLVLNGLEGWEVLPTEALPPAVIQREPADPLSEKPSGIVVSIKGTRSFPVMKYAAMFGFKNLTKVYLRRLFRFLLTPFFNRFKK